MHGGLNVIVQCHQRLAIYNKQRELIRSALFMFKYSDLQPVCCSEVTLSASGLGKPRAFTAVSSTGNVFARGHYTPVQTERGRRQHRIGYSRAAIDPVGT